MIPLTANAAILLAIHPIDFRRQADGLIAHCRHVLKKDPRCGTFFVFINKARTMIRVLVYDVNGFWVMTKRLSAGTFKHWPSKQTPITPFTAAELMRLLRGEQTDPPVNLLTDSKSCRPNKPNDGTTPVKSAAFV